MRYFVLVLSSGIWYGAFARMTQEHSTRSFDARQTQVRRPERPWLRRFLCFTACVLAIDALVGERSLLQTMRANRELTRASVELAALRRENMELRRRVQQLEENPEAIEHAAREELGLIRRGEILVVLRNSPQR
jgi:cell division protein FtsB